MFGPLGHQYRQLINISLFAALDTCYNFTNHDKHEKWGTQLDPNDEVVGPAQGLFKPQIQLKSAAKEKKLFKK